MKKTKEDERLANQGTGNVPLWQRWGPYVSERSWGTVREDYSSDGNAWNYLTFEKSHQNVYRWGEDGIAGWCDRYQVLVFAPAFWNGKDPILKERLFGLSSPEGNHGEDVKEYYYYLDALPSHSYMKYLYKYPQTEFPYHLLKKANAGRGTLETEYELIDTGVFNNNRYFDIFVEYAKEGPDDIWVKIEAINRGDHPAPLHIIPQLWFRNQWSWGINKLPQPMIGLQNRDHHFICLQADDQALISPPHLNFDYHLGTRYLYSSAGGNPLFTNNENTSIHQKYSKNAFHRAIINHENTVNPEAKGTKAGIHYYIDSIAPGKSKTIYLRLTDQAHSDPLKGAEEIFAKKKVEADEFYESIHPPQASADERLIQRQSIAGMLWNKQIYLFDVNVWLKGDNSFDPPPPEHAKIRNVHWQHLNSMRILSMPDKWEYPWFAAWDLAFHCLTLALVDLEFAKEQLWLLLFDQFQHPNGSIPAYEWEFSDLNPPVQAWAAYRIFQMEYQKTGKKDLNFLKKCYLKLLINFAFWVNKVDSTGCNVFEGGFLGLDNITIIDRSKEIGGAMLKQSDGTGWMAMYCLNLMRIGLELAKVDPTYEAMATKFFQHFIYIAYAMHKIDNKHYNLWNAQDGFFYDALVYPDGKFQSFPVRSIVGLIPLYAVDVITEQELTQFPEFKKNFEWFTKNRRELTGQHVIPIRKNQHNQGYVISLLDPQHLEKIVQYIFNQDEFFSPYGVRSLSKFHEKHPFVYQDNSKIGYEPGESLERMKGGNSNWRGPIWFPINYLIIEALKVYSQYFPVAPIKIDEHTTLSFEEAIRLLANRLIGIFSLDKTGKRVFLGPDFSFGQDLHFQNNLLFHEYFHAETGKGLGSCHQTGWTGLVANLIDEFRK